MMVLPDTLFFLCLACSVVQGVLYFDGSLGQKRKQKKLPRLVGRDVHSLLDRKIGSSQGGLVHGKGN
jgi:hypothetical protein